MQPKLGILAGGGELPALLIEACRNAGRDFFVIAFEGQTDESLVTGDVPHAWIRLGAAGKTMKTLKKQDVKELVMAGAIRRPGLKDLRPDLWGAKFLARTGAASLGDDGMLKALIRALEEEGFSVIGVDELLPRVLAPEGPLGSLTPDNNSLVEVEKGVQAALALGSEDIGQGAIIRGGKVLALEDANGTDAMLAGIQPEGEKPSGILVKVSKPGQETRADLPTIGPNTVKSVARAGMAGIAVEAGRSLVIAIEDVVKAADAAGVFVIGIRVPEDTS